MSSNGQKKELRVFVNNQQVSRWIFLERLQLCFKLTANDGGWQNIQYDKGLEVCKRIVSRAGSNGIKVRGTLVDELKQETMVSKLFNEGRIVIGGVLK